MPVRDRGRAPRARTGCRAATSTATRADAGLVDEVAARSTPIDAVDVDGREAGVARPRRSAASSVIVRESWPSSTRACLRVVDAHDRDVVERMARHRCPFDRRAASDATLAATLPRRVTFSRRTASASRLPERVGGDACNRAVDLRVIDFSYGIAGGYCTKLLADAGADVVKVEPPGGDPLAHAGPPAARRPIAVEGGALFRFLHHGKRSVIGGPDDAHVDELVAHAPTSSSSASPAAGVRRARPARALPRARRGCRSRRTAAAGR